MSKPKSAYLISAPEKLWAALTEAEMIKKYWFGMTVECAGLAKAPQI